jgi:hypothetical protein
MYIHSITLFVKIGVLMKYIRHTYCTVQDRLVMDNSCGVPTHSLPSHNLILPSGNTPRQQSDKGKKFAHIDMELANYYHPKRY